MPRVKIPGAISSRCTRGLPLSRSDILALDNIPASGKIPELLANSCSDRRVFISGLTEGGLRLEDIDSDASAKLLRLPPNAVLSRPGKGYEVVHPTDKRVDASEPFRPEWAGYEYHPKWTEGFAPPPMRSHDGRRINPHTVYPPENRRFFVPSGYPNNCIGHLVVTEPGRPSRIGTATLVGSRVILTAAHLAPTDGNPGRWGAFFVPGYMFGNSIVQMASWCEAYRLATVSVTDETQAFDVMVMKLYDPLGDALGFFGARTYDSDWEDESRWTLVGYPGIAAGYQYNGEFPTIETGIRVIDDDPDGSFAEIEHMGDASDGNSGGPLFGIWPDGPYIIGVHSGAEDRTYLGVVAENNNVAAGGSGMVAMIRQARTDWPT